jgi:hypothetical protein
MESILAMNVQPMLRYASMITLYMIGSSLFGLWNHHVETTVTKQSSSNNNNNNNNNNNTRLWKGVSRMAVVIFILSDIWVMMRLPLLGMAFGLVHAAILDKVGVIPFAMTGHMTKIGIGITQEYVLLPSKQHKPSTAPVIDTSYKGYHTSWKGLLAFMGSVLVGNAMAKFMDSSIVATAAASSSSSTTFLWLVSVAMNYLPSFGITLAMLYSSLFRWYVTARETC